MSGSPRCLVTWCHVVDHATLLESHVDKQNTSEIIISNSHVSPAMSHVCHMYSCHVSPAMFVCPAIPAIVISTMRQLTMALSLLSIDSKSCINSCSNRFKLMLSIVPIEVHALTSRVPWPCPARTGWFSGSDFDMITHRAGKHRAGTHHDLNAVTLRAFTVFRWPRSFATRS